MRSSGNSAGHDFEDDDMVDAVEAYPEGEERKVLEHFLEMRMKASS